MGTSDLMALGVLLATAGLVIVGGRRLRGTTLVAPAAWTLFTLVILAGFSLYRWQASWDPRSTAEVGLRLLAGVATFCPMMAVLGAKRPQDRGWQWIVLTLWIVLALPAAEAYFMRRGGSLRGHDARGWFLWILLLISLANGVMTRYWPSVVLWSCAQFLLLAPFLPLLRQSSVGASEAGLMWVALALGMALLLPWLGLPRANLTERGLDRVWHDFRDSFGTIWALRIQERINAAAAQYDWPLRLSWHGFVALDGRQEEAQPWLAQSGHPGRSESGERVEKLVRTSLRRFVSPEWLDCRLAAPQRPTDAITPKCD